MKVLYSVWGFLLCLCFATGNTASALDASPPAVASQGTGTATESGGPRITVTLPLFAPHGDRVPLAVVNDDPITLRDLTDALAGAHEEKDAAKKSAGKMGDENILDRLINVRLVVQEAERIGLDELPEFQSQVDEYSSQALGNLLMKEAVKDVKEADPAAVEKRYQEMVVEWKVRSLFFEQESDAKAMAEALKAGTSFDELAGKAIAEKKATGMEQGNYVKPRDLAPHIMEAVASLPTGSVSPVLTVQTEKTSGFTIVRLEDKRYPENPTAREEAEQAVLNAAKTAEWEKFKTSLLKKYVKIHEKFLNNLDLNSPKADFPKLLKDTRVVAEVKDEEPITVGQLIEALHQKHYHGLEGAAKSKKLNKDKRPVLFVLISKRVIEKEVSARGLAKSEEYQDGLKKYRQSILFRMFVERVVFPDVKVTEPDLMAYYEDHKKEYRFPEMMKLTSLPFEKKRNAESALASLKKGADLNWVQNNAEGVVVKSDDDPFVLKGSILSTTSLPPDMAKALAGARAGDFRLYESHEGRVYVLSIQEVMPEQQQPYLDVREMIGSKVFNEKFIQSMEDWFHKLRSASTVKLYLSGAGQ